ncbi:hypothetical protein JOB18_043337 [Solea senegalensis]|uniref:Uncharacterized protein n=1 Tax=Solea senegalensis TaxID=28829 RepID=A0AAV6S6Y4_SOLSE|nr:hypothetical protein JOB18_043337 [Solea senegalensis]
MDLLQRNIVLLEVCVASKAREKLRVDNRGEIRQSSAAAKCRATEVLDTNQCYDFWVFLGLHRVSVASCLSESFTGGNQISMKLAQFESYMWSNQMS